MTATDQLDEPVGVVVVDDHDLFRTGLVSLLGSQPAIAIIGEASRGDTGIRLVRELRPDVVLMDLRMPDIDGPSATRAILDAEPSTKVLILSVSAEHADVDRAMQAGASGFLAKDTPIADIAAAVRAAASGAAWFSPRAASVVLGRLRTTDPERGLDHGPIERLSLRELDVLRLIARGMQNAAIAETLEISPGTVKNHVSSILAKLGLPGRIQAALYAVRRGLG
jgi:DNA-binding NarL/FixJ family response regulator